MQILKQADTFAWRIALDWHSHGKPRSWQLRHRIPSDLNWLEEPKPFDRPGEVTYKPTPTSGKWYHTTAYDLKPGDRLTPGGGMSPGGEGEWSYYKGPKANRANYVWLSPNLDEANFWRDWAGSGAKVYEVHPGDRPQPWEANGWQGWVVPHATIKREVKSAPTVAYPESMFLLDRPAA